jgi:3-hydroxybutyryl-CoA dehydrogenase
LIPAFRGIDFGLMMSLHFRKMAMAIQTIAVIGAAELGREIARAALLAGHRTILEDVSEGRLAQAAAWIAKTGNVGAVTRAGLVLMGKIEQAVREADLIVEAVADEMEMKIEMFTIFDKFAKPGAIFASTSPSVPIAELAAVTFCPERCIGMRFVSRAGRDRGLHLVCIPQTSEETVAACREVGKRMGKEIVVAVEKELTESR